MRRGLFTFLCVSIMLGATAACGAPAAVVDTQHSPPAEATNVRRTAVAAVQVLIANNSASTPTPEPTATVAPTCQGAIWWQEARTHIGESRMVQGPVVAVRAAPNATTLLELGQVYPDPRSFAVLAPGTIDATLTGKMVCVAGKIVTLEGIPTVQLQAASAVVVVADKP